MSNFCVVNVAFLFVYALIAACVPAEASAEQTKTVEFNVKPGGVVHTFTEGIVSNCNTCLYFYRTDPLNNTTRTQSYSYTQTEWSPSSLNLI